MRIQTLLVRQFDAMYMTVEANVEGLTADQSLVQPTPGGNCANWILGHLVGVQNAVMATIGEAPVWESDELDRAGFDPITGPGAAIDWETLCSRLFASRDRCLAGLSALSDAALDESVPDPFNGTTSRAELLATLAYHQAYHAGQLGLSRRLAGLEGAVRGPGQERPAREQPMA